MSVTVTDFTSYALWKKEYRLLRPEIDFKLLKYFGRHFKLSPEFPASSKKKLFTKII